MEKKGCKILIVDDEEDTVHLAAKRIRSWGHNVICLHEGGKALEVVQRERPDLVLLDIRLPDISGIEVCRRIRAEATLRCIPIVFFSAHGSQEQCGLEQVEAEGFIQKPYDLEEFKRTVLRLLDGKEVQS